MSKMDEDASVELSLKYRLAIIHGIYFSVATLTVKLLLLDVKVLIYEVMNLNLPQTGIIRNKVFKVV